MKKIFLLTGLVLSALLNLHAQTADEIINKYVATIGGREKIKAINTVKITGIVDVGGGTQIPFTNYLKRGGKMKIEATFQGMTQQIAVDSVSGWQINPFQGSKEPQPMSSDDYKMMKEQTDFEGHLVDYKQKGYNANYLGQEDFEGTQVNKISLDGKDQESTTYYIDAETSMLLREVQKFKMSDTEMESETIYGDYRPEAGVMMAHSIEQKTPGQQGSQKITISTVEVNVPIDDAMFVMPQKSVDVQK